MVKNKFIIAIPARLDSVRLPNKVLELIGNKSMIFRVAESCCNLSGIEKTFLCTDNELIAEEVESLPLEIIYKKGNFSSGTDRIFNSINEIIRSLSLPKDFPLKNLYIINVQGDQPFIKSQTIIEFIKYINRKESPEVITSFYKKNSFLTDKCKDIVKLTMSSKNDKVLYFSRSNIPHIDTRSLKNNSTIQYQRKFHIGVYAYRFDILLKWGDLNKSTLEVCESLEQLRWLEYDIPIYAFESYNEIMSIDNYMQLESAREKIKNNP